ncbi:MAG: bifunctional acetaldehyde-CoA/alcohol dehydrogenase [Oscillospiraceae bacterium]|jgi:acetaldehyde dehydrogenase/alcohol dehydrogenase|nr:bifunctional acetaldehyde-CoA/alcohol dehydrogenase [Oscillospiraceae bacterium]
MYETKISSPKDLGIQTAINTLVENAQRTLEAYMNFDQTEVDNIVRSMSYAAMDHSARLAKLALEETSRGVLEDKILKNMYSSEYVFDSMRDAKTVGIINENTLDGYIDIAEPMGVIAGVTPVTNPTSTTIFKSLICAKTRNPIIFAFHPGSQRCCVKTAQILLEAATKYGAPKGCISWIATPSIEATSFLMNHEGISLILATGGTGLVKAAYSSGKPALGVGPGNVPCYIEKSANLERACTDIVISKTFDNGMICASEQAVIVDEDIAEEFEKNMREKGCYFLNSREIDAISDLVISKESNTANPDIVGKTASFIATRAGVFAPSNTKILIARLNGIGSAYPLSREKLSPVLAYYVAKGPREAFTLAEGILKMHGLGHSAVIHSENEKIIREYGLRVKAGRIILNSPSSQGAIGGMYNTNVPSLTLGCGSYGRNSTLSNVSYVNLINKKRIYKRRGNILEFNTLPQIYSGAGSIETLDKIGGFKRIFIVTDESLAAEKIIKSLKNNKEVSFNVFKINSKKFDFEDTVPSIAQIHSFEADAIMAVGSDFVINTAKNLRMFYENPDISLENIGQKFMDFAKRIYKSSNFPKKTTLIIVSTIPAAGNEVSPFSFLTTKKTNHKSPIIDASLQPDIVILDPQFALELSKLRLAEVGMSVLARSMESYVSIMANDFTDSLALKAIELIFDFLTKLQENAGNSLKMLEKVYNASCISGMAYTNTFLGINQSMSQKLSENYNIAQEKASAILLPHVIGYNSSKPTKFVSFSGYERFVADKKYENIAKLFNISGRNTQESIKNLVMEIAKLSKTLGIPASISECGICGENFFENLKTLSESTHEDQFARTNPRYPLISEIEKIYKAAF